MGTMLSTLRCRLTPDSATGSRLQTILARDTRVIAKVISVLTQEEDRLFKQSRSGKWRVSRSDLAELMLPTSNRPDVPYDLKKQFGRISHNELMECIDTAVENYIAYLVNRDSYDASPPTADYRRGYVPRSVGYRRCKLDRDDSTLYVIDSYDTNLRIARGEVKRVRHDYLGLPIVLSDYHKIWLDHGTLKAVTIVCDQDRSVTDPDKYWAHLAIETEVSELPGTKSRNPDQPLAVIGIDLGLSTSLTAAVLTGNGVIASKLFCSDHDKIAGIDDRIGDIQQEIDHRDRVHYSSLIQFYSNQLPWKLRQDLLQLHTSLRDIDRLGSRSVQGLAVKKQVQAFATEIRQHRKDDRSIPRGLLLMLNRLVHYWDILNRTDGLTRKLRQLRDRRANLIDDMTKQLCARVSRWIHSFAESYDIRIAIGDVKHIRKSQRRGNGQRWLRKHVNQWRYGRLYEQLYLDLAKIGLADRWNRIPEYWTSTTCHRCNKRGQRPSQNRFVCSNYHCLWRGHADINGAINIAKRLVKWRKLVPRKEHCYWWIEPAS